jgi:glycine dehydrogenase
MNAPFKPVSQAAATFARRHIGPSPRDISAMLETVGAGSLEALMAETLPSSIRQKAALDLGPAFSETEALAHMRELASQNEVFTSLIGQGYSGTILPAVIQRNILENPAWYTAYTPYQPEISQGRLEALFNFQTMICDLTGLDVANASLLDEATAAAEAMALAERAAPATTKSFFVDHEVHPQTLAVLRTRAEPLGWNLIVGDPLVDLERADVFGGLLQYPGTSGAVRDLRPAIAALHAKGRLAIVAADLLALSLLASPGELGADIAVGSAQRFGVPMGYGGPHAAYMAVRDALKRSLPGRIVGLSVDSRGEPAYRLALQTREQHIRREKATSNICTAQVLLAVIASMYAVYHGPEGLTEIARLIHRRAAVLAAGLGKLGFTPTSDAFFDTVSVNVGDKQAAIVTRAREQKINLRIGQHALDGTLGIALDEATTDATVEAAWRAFGGQL